MRTLRTALAWLASLCLTGCEQNYYELLLEPVADGVSVHAYAAWAVPDYTWQAARFGKTLLQGEGLLAYVIWYKGLIREQAAEWDAFLSRLTPDAAPAAKITNFLFKAERDAGPATAEALERSTAQRARKLLLDALAPTPLP